MLRLFCSIGFVVALLLVSQPSLAHEVRPSIFTLKFDEARSFTLIADANLEALIAGIGSEHEDTDQAPQAAIYNSLRALPAPDLQDRFKAFSNDWMNQLGLEFDGQPAAVTLHSVEVPEIGNIGQARDSVVTLSGQVPDGARNLNWSYPEKFGSSVLRIERPDQELQAQFFAAGAQSDEIAIGVADADSWSQKFYEYAEIGFTHILPKGLDHILFVLGLFLLNANWRPLLWQVTAFTIAHSVTLALGLYGVVEISPSIVEPLIALSIVYVAVENIFTDRLHAWRPVIVFAFGLLHGLGFAGILTEIGLTPADFVLGLVAFNVGVELGQLAVIALAFLAVGLYIKKPWYRQAIAIPASAAIAAIGAWWFVERTFL